MSAKREKPEADAQLSLLARSPPPPTAGVPAPAAAPPPAGVTAAPAPAPREAAASPRVYRVAELVNAARTTLEARFSAVLVEGEVGGVKWQASGHLYFALKDGDAQIDCVMWASDNVRLRFKPQDGMVVRCRGKLTIYPQRGKFQMVVTRLDPTGEGALALAFEQRKAKLQAEGLFDPARKRPLPFLPRRIGVVTSRSGAVLRDIIQVAHRRYPVAILLAQAPVQGPGADLRIAAAIRALGEVPDVDLVIVARGGGSLEDLWSFNEESVARAIAACRVPVISAIGHETDFTIADFVADLRAPTPSAAAERAVPVAADLRMELGVLGGRVGRAVRGRVQSSRLALVQAGGRLGDPRRLIGDRRQMLDDLVARAGRRVTGGVRDRRQALKRAEVALARRHPQRRIAEQRALLATLGHRLRSAGLDFTRRRRALCDSFAHKLDALSPLRVLERGYSLTRGPDGRLLTRAADVRPGDCVEVTLHEGRIDATVKDVRGEGRGPRR